MYVEERFALSSDAEAHLRSIPVRFGFDQFGAAVYFRCVATGTKILTADLRWVPAELLREGDALLGVDEVATREVRRKLRPSVVEDCHLETDECYLVRTTKGDITVSTEHPFLARHPLKTRRPLSNPGRIAKNRWNWLKVEELSAGDEIQFFHEPWESESGDSWLAGLLDGEGSLHARGSGLRVALAQNFGTVVEAKIRSEIEGRGFKDHQFVEDKQHKVNSLASHAVNGVRNSLRYLGVVRPVRLLDRWLQVLSSDISPTFGHADNAFVLSVEPVGPRQIVSLQTSTRTFIAEGFVCHNTYSRLKEDGSQEQWPDTVIRVINGVMSIRKDWYIRKMGLPWDEAYWQGYAFMMADYMAKMKWLPPGRGLWAMGTNYVYERGSMALNNCAFVHVSDETFDGDLAWIADALMNGVGVGADALQGSLSLKPPQGPTRHFTISDDREGWVESIRLLVRSYMDGSNPVEFDYSRIRPAGAPIRGFGGTASGPEPLRKLHGRLRHYCSEYVHGRVSRVRLVADCVNAIGCMVVAGSVRRSAEILLGSVHDTEFRNLKNKGLYPERQDVGWMSNNSVVLREPESFEAMPSIAEQIRDNGEPGIVNMVNIQKYARFGKPKPDTAIGTNPCGEAVLESTELCCLSEVYPTRCLTADEYLEACQFASFYASTVSMLPTHSTRSNQVIARNHRIGVSISGVVDWIQKIGAARATRLMREGYKVVVSTNEALARAAGIPASIRCTVVKPSGTTSNLASVSPGMHYPAFTYAIRRMRIGVHTKIAQFLLESSVPFETDLYSDDTLVFEFPIQNGEARPVTEVSVWEQAALLAMLQREWADQSVSATLSFNPDTESAQIEHLLAQFAPVVKSLSMLPHIKQGVYPQSPYEGLSREEYESRKGSMPDLDWSRFSGSDGQDEKYCATDSCELPSIRK